MKKNEKSKTPGTKSETLWKTEKPFKNAKRRRPYCTLQLTVPQTEHLTALLLPTAPSISEQGSQSPAVRFHIPFYSGRRFPRVLLISHRPRYGAGHKEKERGRGRQRETERIRERRHEKERKRDEERERKQERERRREEERQI